jgi:hypothetical protein
MPRPYVPSGYKIPPNYFAARGASGMVPGNAAVGVVPWPGVKASALITCVAKDSLADTEFLRLTSVDPATSLQQQRVYEFDLPPDGITGDVVVDVSGDTTAEDVRDTLLAAIQGDAANINLTAVAVGTTQIRVTQNFAGEAGEQTIVETVANTGFLVNGSATGTDSFVGGLNPTPLAPAIMGPRRGGNVNQGPCPSNFWGGVPPGYPAKAYCLPEDIEAPV